MTIYQCDLCGKDISTTNDIAKVSSRSYGLLASGFLRGLRQAGGAVSHACREDTQEHEKVIDHGMRPGEARMKRLEDALTV